jgi:predicted dehydrogenase
MDKVRWGLLSTANINKQVIPPIRASERGELAAVASRAAAPAAAYAHEWDIPLSFGSYEEMLASDAIDAVYIGLPNHLHAVWSINAMRHGKHVLCEKPFTLTVAEAEQVARVSEETGMVVAEAFMYRHHPQTKIAGQFVQDGKLGEVTAVSAHFHFKLTDYANVRLMPELGGGSIWDVGCYPISIAQYFMGGPPQWVFGDQWTGETGVDETFVGQMHYSRGRMAQFTSGFRTPFYCHVEVLGTNGRLTLTQPFRMDLGNDHLIFENEAGERTELEVPQEALYQGEIEDLQSAILDGMPTYITLEESRNHIRTITALLDAAKHGRIVELTP